MLFFKKKNKQNNNYSQRMPVPKTLENTFTFNVTGTKHYENDISNLGTPSKWYDAPLEKLKTSNKQRHYQYYFGDLFYGMMPEPTNPYDKEAIIVLANGVKIGYVPAIYTDIVRAYMQHNNVKVSGYIMGGNYIAQNFGKWQKELSPYNCEITISLT